MKGTVVIFNAVKGIGFLEDENGERRFFQQNSLQMFGFRAIAVGKSVEFMPAENDGRPAAKGLSPLNRTGLEVADPRPRAILVEKNKVPLRVDTIDRIYAKEDLWPFGEFLVAPSVWVEGAFRAFKTNGRVDGFTIRLPNSTDRTLLLLDADKRPIATPPGASTNAAIGSYLLSLEQTGALDIQCMGRRYQPEKGGGNWVVLEHRFRHKLNLNEEGIASQIPTSGLERDNDGFMPGIRRAMDILAEKAVS